MNPVQVPRRLTIPKDIKAFQDRDLASQHRSHAKPLRPIPFDRTPSFAHGISNLGMSNGFLWQVDSLFAKNTGQRLVPAIRGATPRRCPRRGVEALRTLSQGGCLAAMFGEHPRVPLEASKGKPPDSEFGSMSSGNPM